MKEMICISCPRGCHLTVEEQAPYTVTGNVCPRGAEYGKHEVTNPLRTVTSTIWLEQARRTCPVKTDRPIPKGEVFRAVRSLKDVQITGDIRRGQVILEKVCGTEANFIATKDVAVERGSR